MWVEYCVALLTATIRVNPIQVPSEIITASGLISTGDDEKGKFFMLIDEIILSNDV